MEIAQIHKIPELIGLTPLQRQFRFDETRFIRNAAGRRARKTLIAKKKLLSCALKTPNSNYFGGAPTEKQAKRLLWEDLKRWTYHVRTDKSEQDMIVRFPNNSMIQVVGLDVPERIEGSAWDGCLITEFADIKKEAWLEHIRPMLSEPKREGFAILEGTPDYRSENDKELTKYFCGGDIPKPLSIIGAYTKNPTDLSCCFYSWLSSDVMSPDEIKLAKKQMDELSFRQEYEAEYITMGVTTYYAYSADNHTDVEYNPSVRTIICWDFNVDPMTAILCQEFEKDKWYAVKEFITRNSNTEHTCEVIKGFLEDNHHNGILQVTGDYSGLKRSSDSSYSDWFIIDRNFKNYPDYRRFTHPTYSIKDRVNAMNARLKNYDGDINFYVNATQCPVLDEDFRMVVWLKGQWKLDGSNQFRTHATDAVSYHSMNLYPQRRHTEGYII